MRKIWLILGLLLSWWLFGGQKVHAALNPGYDPAQGGLIFEPPKELWVPTWKQSNYSNFISTDIPFAYARPGTINQAMLRSQIYQVIYKGKAYPLSTSPQMVEDGVIFTITATNIEISAYIVTAGDYDLTFTVRYPEEQVVHSANVLIHARPVAELTPITQPLLPTERLITNMPVSILWQRESNQLTTVRLNSNILPIALNTNTWVGYPITYAIPWTSIASGISSGLLLPTSTQIFSQLDGSMPFTLNFGITDITAVEGQPIQLGADYIHARDGTDLTFAWQYQPNGGKTFETVTSKTPYLDIPTNWHQDGQIFVDLIYSYNGFTYTLRTSAVPYHFQPLTPIDVNLADLAKEDVHLPSTWADWPINRSGDWRVNIAMTQFQNAAGKTLDAALKLPNGEQATADQPLTMSFSGAQVLPLSQIEWLLYKQPAILAGRYQTTVQFTLIAGPQN